ncbi:hypothetical protein Pint_06743 [Pistacia integerrima]|uniref:Uncharacterized protein n=1 Tax=Pistacia integerrima TaxID=434235 RepID=A0ACC0XW87_9ROSI|nr:hypothetical protein Pint_06743 [Pistacia integerrima]
MDMGLKLKNRKVAESKLAKFVEDIIIPPRMVDIIVDGEVMESINNIICLLTKVVTKSKSFHSDVSACKLQRFMEKDSGGGEIFFLWAELVFDFIVQKLYALRKPKTNIQILQQNILLKYK